MTKRYDDVTRLLMQGLSNKEIAKELGLAEDTVKNYLHIIYAIYRIEGGRKRVKLAMVLHEKENAATAHANGK